MLQQIYQTSLGILKNTGKNLFETSKELAESAIDKVPAETLEKVKELYANNK